jgi:hypothetical protein
MGKNVCKAEGSVFSCPGAGALLAALVLSAVCVGPVCGLINPDFTPVDLVRQSTVIVSLKAGAPKGRAMAVTELQPLKGKLAAPPDRLTIANDTVAGLIEDEAIFDGVEAVDALLFLLVEKGKVGTEATRGSLSMDGIWFNVTREPGGAWRVSQDAGGMRKAIFNGQTGMLKRCVQYILKSERPSVPVSVGVKWGTAVKIGQVESARARCVVVELGGDGRKTLLIASGAGDRAFQAGAKGTAWKEVTGALGLDSRSREVAFGDLDGDGRLDLVSLTGKGLEIRRQTEGGTFAAAPVGVDVDGVETLCALGLGNGRCGIVGGGGGGVPTLCRLGGNGGIEAAPIVELPEGQPSPGGGLGSGLAAEVADFDGDGAADVLQVFTEGVLFYRGTGGAGFAAPKRQGDLYAGSAGSRVYVCDLDADGVLDLIFVGEEGFAHWGGRGDGTFEVRYRNGETDYIARKYCSAGALGDFNNDGRQDVLILYSQSSAHPFFNRGFASMGFAAELDFTKTGFPRMKQGQQDGVLADLTGDGHEDFVTILRDGTIWLVPVSSGVPGLRAEVALPGPDAGGVPVSVTGRLKDRCLGVRHVRPGMPASFARSRPGVIALRFGPDGARRREINAVVAEGPVRITIPASEK